MKRKQNVKNIVILAVILFAANFSFGQIQSTPAEWKDGNPTFLKSRPSDKFVSFTDSTKTALGLTPEYATSEDSTVNLILDGVDWKWPNAVNILSARDIDYRKIGDQELYMVVDALGRRVIEYNLNSKTLTWEYGSTEPSNSQYLDRPVDARTYQDTDGLFKVLITDNTNHRVVKIDQTTKTEVWSYGTAGLEGSGNNQLSNPEDAVEVPGQSQYIIADAGNDRVILVDEATKAIIWKSGDGVFNNPVDVEYSPDDSLVLVTDKGNDRIVLIKPKSNEIVWEFPGTVPEGDERILESPSDADLLDSGNILISDEGNQRLIEVDRSNNIVWTLNRTVVGLKDADRLPNNKHLAVHYDDNYTSNRPIRFGYKDSTFVSKVYDLNKDAIFDSLFWVTDNLSEDTSVRLQLRSSTSLSGLEAESWYGPKSNVDYYENSNSTTNTLHDGDRFYQFKANLITDDPLYTPVLKRVGLNYKYYPTGTPVRSVYADQVLKNASDNTLVTQWNTIEFNTVIPSDPTLKNSINIEVQIWNYDTFKNIISYTASKTNENNKFSLESVTELQGKQRVYLFANMSTTNSSVTPILEDWSLSYEVVNAVTSDLYFSGSKGKKVTHYRAPTVLPSLESKVDSVDVRLVDYDLQAFQDTITVAVHSKFSTDVEDMLLTIDGNNIFKLSTKLPLLISDKSTQQNGIVEVFDRDTLTVFYQDPHNASDSASIKISVVQNTEGGLQIVDKNRNQVTEKIDFGKILYLYVFDENDKNLNPVGQDTIHVKMFDRTTNDEETVVLYEISGNDGSFNTGEFLSNVGITVVASNNGIQGDNQLQALASHTITAEYSDNVTKTASVSVKDDGTSGITIYLGGEVYIAEVAPNPFYANEYDNFRIRVASATGALRVRLLEIFNLAGEKVKEIDGSTLSFNVGPTVPQTEYGIAEHWWDLKNDDGQQVASGTYFVKVHADLLESNSDNFESVTYLRKFMVVR